LEALEITSLYVIAGLAFVALGLRRDDNDVRRVTALPPAATAKSPSVASAPKDLAEIALILKRFSGFRARTPGRFSPPGNVKILYTVIAIPPLARGLFSKHQ